MEEGGLGVSLWLHETLRIFYDRLINDEDRTWFTGLLSGVLDIHNNCDSVVSHHISLVYVSSFGEAISVISDSCQCCMCICILLPRLILPEPVLDSQLFAMAALGRTTHITAISFALVQSEQ